MTTDAQAFSGRLLANERVAWAGRPATGLLFAPRDVFLIPFSVVWCGFVIFAVLGATLSIGGIATLFGLVFLLVGLFLSVGRFLLDAWLRANTRYALTDQRILILREGPFRSFTAIALDRLPEAQISERRDRSGNVRFGQQQSLLGVGRTGFSVWVPALDPTPQFIAIPEARKVFDLVQRASLRNGR